MARSQAKGVESNLRTTIPVSWFSDGDLTMDGNAGIGA
jgi:hypothetical protein